MITFLYVVAIVCIGIALFYIVCDLIKSWREYDD